MTRRYRSLLAAGPSGQARVSSTLAMVVLRLGVDGDRPALNPWFSSAMSRQRSRAIRLLLRLDEPTPTGAGTSQIVAAQNDAVYPDGPRTGGHRGRSLDWRHLAH